MRALGTVGLALWSGSGGKQPLNWNDFACEARMPPTRSPTPAAPAREAFPPFFLAPLCSPLRCAPTALLPSSFGDALLLCCRISECQRGGARRAYQG